MGIKAIIVAVVLSVLAGGGYWAYTMVENLTLVTTERDDALKANASVIEDNNYLLNEIRTRDADILERERFITNLSIATDQMKEELADAKTKLSAEERVCLDANVPAPYRDRLRKRSGSEGDEDRKTVPTSNLLPAVSVSRVHRRELGRHF